MNQVTAQLLNDGGKAFADSFDKLLENIKEKQEQSVSLRTEAHPDHDRMLGVESPEAASAMADREHRNVFNRIWRGDHTVWRSDPEEISNRLGWLSVTDQMVEQTPNLLAFASEIRQDGYHHVVLLGMGGNSLGPEVLRQTSTPVQGYPELLVLDFTVPAQVGNVTQQIDPARTLFLVSSKSGGTTETLSFYRYLRRLAEATLPGGGAGRNFVAITDPQVLHDWQWPHMVALLQSAHAAGCRIALATSSLTKEAHNVLAALNLEDQFEEVIDTDQVPNPKPDPQVCLLAASRLGVPPQSAWSSRTPPPRSVLVWPQA